MEQVVESALEKKPIKAPDRISVSSLEAQKLDSWLKQIHDASRGFLSISRSDLVAFLIRSHREELLPSEMKRLRADHYDPIRHIQWIMPQIKSALSAGDAARVGELQAELRSVELSLMGPETFALAHDARPIQDSIDLTGLPLKHKRKSKKENSITEIDDSTISELSDKNAENVAK